MASTFLFLMAALVCRFGTTSAQGRYIYHEFNVRFFDGAPNGVRKQILGVNDQFPGPTIHAQIGDFLEVKVINNIQTRENTSIHWHGLEQYQVPFEDGPEYVTQCPIMYGHSQTYKFQLVQAGTYWWHSHHAWQYTEGYWGAIVIQNNPEAYGEFYNEELTIALSDWFNPSVASITEWYLSKESQGNPPVPDSVLINGVGMYPCEAARAQGFQCDTAAQGYPVFNVTRGETYRIRVINTAAAITTSFSIDGHKLRVIEVDGVDTVLSPPVDVVTIAPAQRYSFLVRIDQPGMRRFWIRLQALDVPIRLPNSNPDPSKFDPNAYAVLQYTAPSPDQAFIAAFLPQSVDPPVIQPSQGRPPTHDGAEWLQRQAQFGNMTRQGFRLDRKSYSLATVFRSVDARNLPKTRPAPELVELNESDCRPIGTAAPDYYTQQVTLEVFNERQRDGSFRWSFNKRIYTMSRNHEPALYQVLKSKRVEVGFNPIYTDFGRGKVVQVVINNPLPAPHPFHLHGHTAYVVGRGRPGDGHFLESLHNSTLRVDDVRRDTVVVEGNSYTVLRYYADNPGTWLLHCHINWHLHAGLGMVFVEGANAIRAFTRVPMEWIDVCQRSSFSFS